MKDYMTLEQFEKAVNTLNENGKGPPYKAWIDTPRGMAIIKGKSAKELWKKYRRKWKKMMKIITIILAIMLLAVPVPKKKVRAGGGTGIGTPAYHEPECGIGEPAYHEPAGSK